MYASTGTKEVIEWIVDHLQVIGWPIAVGLIWRGRGVLDSFLTTWKVSAQKIAVTETTAAAIKLEVDTLTTNHFKHLEESMAALAVAQGDANKLLTSIDKGIAVLAARVS